MDFFGKLGVFSLSPIRTGILGCGLNCCSFRLGGYGCRRGEYGRRGDQVDHSDSVDADCIDLGKGGVVGLPGMVLEEAEDRWRDYLQIFEAD